MFYLPGRTSVSVHHLNRRKLVFNRKCISGFPPSRTKRFWRPLAHGKEPWGFRPKGAVVLNIIRARAKKLIIGVPSLVVEGFRFSWGRWLPIKQLRHIERQCAAIHECGNRRAIATLCLDHGT